MRYKELKGKVGVVTGPVSETGEAIIRRFIKEGMKVVINHDNPVQQTLKTHGNIDIWVNNTGGFPGVRKAIRYFLENRTKGNIINVSGIQEKESTQTLALEYARRGIRINTVVPAQTATAEEITNIVVWLASGESGYITGTTIKTDEKLSF
ncbi:MAG: hypothetical protein LIP01_16465 [Tannerellaceae bacterium]|nr:hypothetical protein [Tannerellaceae bacterium]